MPSISEAKILILATNGFEQSELEFPRDQLRAKGATVHVASPDGEDIRGWEGEDWGRTAEVDMRIGDTHVSDYDAIVLPGGQINPDLLRVETEAVDRVRDAVKSGQVVAAICHGPWLLVEAGVIEGREVTGYPSIRTDLKNAGAVVKDEAVVCDNGLITSRNPDDLKAFVAKIVEEVEERHHSTAAA